MQEYNLPPSAQELRLERLSAHLGKIAPEFHPGIKNALKLAEKAHEKQKRASGESYVVHPLHVALYLLDFGDPKLNLGIDDPDVISAALLHDAPEDMESIHEEPFNNNKEWMDRADKLMEENNINPRVRQFVAALTKPKIDGIDVFTEDQRRNQAIEQLEKAEPEVLLIKMADRLHNLQTLGSLDKWKAEMVIAETQGVMYSVFSRILSTKYRQEGLAMFRQMRAAICEYEKRANRWNDIYSFIPHAAKEA